MKIVLNLIGLAVVFAMGSMSAAILGGYAAVGISMEFP